MIKIVCDSTADLSKVYAERNDIAIVPLKVNFNNTEYLDGVTIQKDEFYDALVNQGVFPKTSQPTPNDFLSVFEKIQADGDECICITLSSSLSGTYQSALLAKKLCEYEKIHVIDSLSATAGTLLLINEAVKMVNDGRQASEIVKTIEELKKRIKIVASLSTLEYLKKGGRISAASAAIGSLARIKPLITVDGGGNVDVFAKAIGYQKAISTITEALGNADQDYPIYPVYTFGTKNLEKLIEGIDGEYELQEAIQIGPTIGTHIGPEVFGFCFIENKQ